MNNTKRRRRPTVRVWARVSPEVAEMLREMQRAGGYRSQCSLATALLTAAAALRAEHTASEPPTAELGDEVGRMLREYSDAEQPRYGDVPVRRRRRREP